METRYQHYADRIRELISEGQSVALDTHRVAYGRHVVNGRPLQSWLVRVENVIAAVFGTQGVHGQYLDEYFTSHGRAIEYPEEVQAIVGILEGALSDLEGGYLASQEFLVAGQVFDSVLGQARHLNQNGYKDPAAVLVRVVLEDALRRIARSQGLDDTQSAGRINDALREADRYSLQQWKLVQQWLDTGDAAAHGNFDRYTQEDVEGLLDDVERFLAVELRNP